MDGEAEKNLGWADNGVSYQYDPGKSAKEILSDNGRSSFPKCPFCGSPVTATKGMTESGFVFCGNCHRKMHWRILQRDDRPVKEIVDDGKV